jgi:hypothetical protein
MLIYKITILNIALINFIMIVSIIVGVSLAQSYFCNFYGNLISAVFCSQLRAPEIKIAEYYVKYYVQNTFSNSNADSA